MTEVSVYPDTVSAVAPTDKSPVDAKRWYVLLHAIFGEASGRYDDKPRELWSTSEGNLDDVLWKAIEIALAPRLKRVIAERFGLLDNRPRTHEEISKGFHVQRGRIAQIEWKALSLLRHPSVSKPLKGFLYKYTDADNDAVNTRSAIHSNLLKAGIRDPLAYKITMRLHRTHLFAAHLASQGHNLKRVGQVAALSCKEQMADCPLCGDPAIPGSLWCLMHLGLRSRVVVVCDGCGEKFTRSPSNLVHHATDRGPKRFVFHNRACLRENGRRLGVYRQRVEVS